MRREVKHPNGRTLTEEYCHNGATRSLPGGSSELDAKVVFTVLDERGMVASVQWFAIQFNQRHPATLPAWIFHHDVITQHEWQLAAHRLRVEVEPAHRVGVLHARGKHADPPLAAASPGGAATGQTSDPRTHADS